MSTDPATIAPQSDSQPFPATNGSGFYAYTQILGDYATDSPEHKLLTSLEALRNKQIKLLARTAFEAL